MKSILYLASMSPRRREILQSLGIEFTVTPVDIDEQALPDETPAAMVLRLATAKANAAAQGDIVLAADTMVVLGDRVLGKPRDADDAVEMLTALSGHTHIVMTGVALKTPQSTQSVMSATHVQFREISPDEAYRYWHSGEPSDKAGAYGIQEWIGKIGITRIEGDYYNVMGLPACRVYQELGLFVEEL